MVRFRPRILHGMPRLSLSQPGSFLISGYGQLLTSREWHQMMRNVAKLNTELGRVTLDWDDDHTRGLNTAVEQTPPTEKSGDGRQQTLASSLVIESLDDRRSASGESPPIENNIP
mmetsp:Transcript_3246/g.6673  ORF Transcript_3246/g.6673 Transcript_3246/m.6673 type:complete len:115 (-) Transcript_3246:3660-4004(-)